VADAGNCSAGFLSTEHPSFGVLLVDDRKRRAAEDMLDSANGICVYLCPFAQTGDVFAFSRMQKYAFKRSPVSALPSMQHKAKKDAAK
jgi:hypothetical protein